MSVASNPGDLTRRLLEWPGEGRVLVAIAGAPGSGKSTLAGAMVARLNAARPGCAAVLEMDGYHYDDRVLKDLGRHARKGAADTFDTGGLRQMLTRLRENAEVSVAVPVFDRELEIARAGARLIAKRVRIIVVEGNYLLLRKQPWDGIAGLFDLTVMISAREETLRERLTRRWESHGLDASEIRRKIEENDLPNGRLVAMSSAAADVVLPTEEAYP